MTWSVTVTAENGDFVEVVGFKTFGEAMDAAEEIAVEEGPLLSVEVSR